MASITNFETLSAIKRGVTGTAQKTPAETTQDAYVSAAQQMNQGGGGQPITAKPAASPYSDTHTYSQGVQPAAAPITQANTGAVAGNPVSAPAPAQQQAAPAQNNGTYYSQYDQQNITSKQDQDLLTYYKNGWAAANAAGNSELAQQYNDLANQLRAKYNYYGGTDGSLGSWPGQVQAGVGQQAATQFQQMQGLAAYITAQSRAATDAAKTGLTSAYNQNNIDIQALAAKLPALYEQARNATSGSAAVNAAGFNEYAAAHGLNSGAGGQAQLAMNNALLGQMGSINQQQTAAQQDIEFEIQRIARAYQDAIAQAEATGKWQEAQMLYQDAARVLEANFGLQFQQADENFRNQQFNYGVGRDQISDAQYADSQNYNRTMDIVSMLLQSGVPLDSLPPELLQTAFNGNSGALQSYLSYMQAMQTPQWGGGYGYGGDYNPLPSPPTGTGGGMSSPLDVKDLTQYIQSGGNAIDYLLPNPLAKYLNGSGSYSMPNPLFASGGRYLALDAESRSASTHFMNESSVNWPANQRCFRRSIGF